MKKGFLVFFTTLSVLLISVGTIHAQDTTTAGQDIKRAAKKVGNKTAEIASKGKSAIVDKVYDGKQGPNGQKIYIDGQSKYYYVDKKGHKKYVKESKLKDKS